MSELPGNPYVAGPTNYMAEMHANGRSDSAMVASAMLALAYEQRTANLLAMFAMTEDTFISAEKYSEIAEELRERLSL